MSHAETPSDRRRISSTLMDRAFLRQLEQIQRVVQDSGFMQSIRLAQDVARQLGVGRHPPRLQGKRTSAAGDARRLPGGGDAAGASGMLGVCGGAARRAPRAHKPNLAGRPPANDPVDRPGRGRVEHGHRGQSRSVAGSHHRHRAQAVRGLPAAPPARRRDHAGHIKHRGLTVVDELDDRSSPARARAPATLITSSDPSSGWRDQASEAHFHIRSPPSSRILKRRWPIVRRPYGPTAGASMSCRSQR